MAVSPSFRSYVLEQLGRAVPGVRARSMFGGAAILVGDVCFALLSDDTLYFRVNDETRPSFEARGMPPFRPFGEERGSMPYYELPPELLEDPDALRPWAERALAAARERKAAQARPKKSPRKAKRRK